jgi:hypothetical protein
VYPVYWRLAADARLAALRIETFPELDTAAVFASARSERVTDVLLPCPLKLQGRSWTPAEVTLASRWLAEDAERRLLLDGVYSFGRPLDAAVLTLLATDQVYYLDSLSKGWLHEQVFGTTIVPERDAAEQIPRFRAAGAPQELLHLADVLLTEFEGFPDRLCARIDGLRTTLSSELRDRGLVVNDAATGYLLYVEGDAREILERHGLLTIPVSAFGSERDVWSIASALPAEPA